LADTGDVIKLKNEEENSWCNSSASMPRIAEIRISAQNSKTIRALLSRLAKRNGITAPPAANYSLFSRHRLAISDPVNKAR
jgi:hypothetical protein